MRKKNSESSDYLGESNVPPDTNVLVIFTVTYGVNDIYHSNITILGTFLKVLEFVVENFKH